MFIHPKIWIWTRIRNPNSQKTWIRIPIRMNMDLQHSLFFEVAPIRGKINWVQVLVPDSWEKFRFFKHPTAGKVSIFKLHEKPPAFSFFSFLFGANPNPILVNYFFVLFCDRNECAIRHTGRGEADCSWTLSLRPLAGGWPTSEAAILRHIRQVERVLWEILIRIRIDLALLDTDPYWECGSGFRSKEIDQSNK